MKRIIDFLTLLLLAALIGTAAADIKAGNQPHSVRFQIKLVKPGVQGNI
jgi:hypothetical protein